MGFAAVKIDETYTYADYLTWSDDERWEIIEGVAHNMSPAPSTEHQRVCGKLFIQISNFLDKSKKCEAFFAPFDVRLTETRPKRNDKIINIVQPDISVICDPDKIDDKGCLGEPDFIIEVISPFTASRDYIRKQALYEKHGVKEYWLVHPFDSMVTVFVMGENGKYEKPIFYEGKGSVDVKTLPGLSINLDEVFGR